MTFPLEYHLQTTYKLPDMEPEFFSFEFGMFYRYKNCYLNF